MQCPSFIAHGASDTFIPPFMSDQLAAAAAGPVTRVVVPNVGHNDILLSGGPPLYDPLAKWIAHLPDVAV